MSQLDSIQSAQKSLEDCFTKRMADLEQQIQSAGPAKDTVAKVAEEFRTFRELMFGMLGILRKQIEECTSLVDTMETRHRRKDLIFLGVGELEKEDCTATLLDILKANMGLKDISADSISSCHRLGAPNKNHHRPIHVRFTRIETKAAIWRAKSELKGSKISIKEFLTKARQSIFVKARLCFGMRSCWTQDGIIIIKVPDGSRIKVTSSQDLDRVLMKHPRRAGSTSAAREDGAGSLKTVQHQDRTRKN